MPHFPGIDERGFASALATYRRLLPKWTVTGIACMPLILEGGAVHCITMNLCREGLQN